MDNAARHSVSPAAWVPTLYFAEGAPFFVVSLIAGIFYKRLGLPNDIIALYTSWLLLPWSLKPIWSPLLEMFRTKKFFVVLFEFISGASLLVVASCLPLQNYFRYTLALFALLACSSATHDVAADGLYIASFVSGPAVLLRRLARRVLQFREIFFPRGFGDTSRVSGIAS
jgi:MFS transporter, PAT family, beta-lactamase induction signal transducer AmpG